MPGKDHVLCGLIRPGPGVDIGRRQTRGLGGHQFAPVIALAGDGVAGRGVDQHRRPGEGELDAGGQGRPEVFADLHAHDELRQFPAGKEQVGGEGDLLAEPMERAPPLEGGGELAQFVELGVVGQVRLGHHAQHMPALQYRRAVVQAVAIGHGKTDDDEHVHFPRRVQHSLQPFQRPAHEAVVQEQIAAGVAGQAQFGKDADVRALRSRFQCQIRDLRGVFLHIGHFQRRGGRAQAHKSVEHGRSSFESVSVVVGRAVTAGAFPARPRAGGTFPGWARSL